MPATMKTPEEYLKEPYSRILVPAEEGGFSAEMLEFPGCIAEGETAEEALQNLEAAARSWIEAALEQDQEIPLPASSQGFSGKLALRLPRGLHRQAVRMAARDGVSLNQYLLTAVAARVGADDIFNRITQRLQQTQFNLNAVVLFSAATDRRIKRPPVEVREVVANTTVGFASFFSDPSLFAGLVPAHPDAENR
jgi:predicted RNase H-like HicB family nuclease